MKKIFILLYIVTTIAIFIIPYFFDNMEVSQSVPYMVGYNKGIAILFLFISGLLFLVLGLKSDPVCKGWQINNTFTLSKFALRTVLISFIFIELIGFLLSSKDFFGFIEGAYIMHYVYAIKYGVTLYNEIQFIYGPLAVYPVCFLSALGLTEHYSYYLVIGLYQAAGLIMAYYILLKFELSDKERNIILFLIAAVIFPYTQGFSNVLLRYVIAPFFMIYYITNKKKQPYIAISIYSLLFPLFTLLLSPEIGLSYFCAVTIWLIMDLIIRKNYVNIVYISLQTIVLISLLIIYPDYLSSVIQASSGGSNFPFVPSLALLLYFFYIFTIAFIIGIQIKEIKRNFDYICLEILLLAFVLAAAGRCDPWHVIAFGLFLVVLTYIYMKYFLGRKTVALFLILSVLSFFPYQFKWFLPFTSNVLMSNKELVKSVATKYAQTGFLGSDYVQCKLKSINIKEKEEKNPLDLINGIVTSVDVDEKTFVELLQKPGFQNSYFGHTLRWIGKKSGFERELDELKKINANYLVLKTDYEEDWLSSNDYSSINLLFFTYYPVKPKRYYNNYLYGDIISYIKGNYFEVGRNKNCIVLKKFN